MVRFAANRHRVRLDDGRPVSLVRWPLTGRGRARVETSSAKPFTVTTARVVEVNDEVSCGQALHVDV